MAYNRQQNYSSPQGVPQNNQWNAQQPTGQQWGAPQQQPQQWGAPQQQPQQQPQQWGAPQQQPQQQPQQWGAPQQQPQQQPQQWGSSPNYGQPHSNQTTPSSGYSGYGTTPSPYSSQQPQSYGYGSQMPPPGVSPDIWQWFRSVDSDNSGKITAQELQQALLNGNWSPFNNETCRLMIGMFDRDGSGTIDVHEFGALWRYIQEWKACFDRFDTDRSGNINVNELHNAFSTFGYRLSLNFAQICVRTFDRQAAQSVKFDDFIQCCVMLKTLTDKFRAKDTQQQGQIRISYEEFLQMVLDTTR